MSLTVSIFYSINPCPIKQSFSIYFSITVLLSSTNSTVLFYAISKTVSKVASKKLFHTKSFGYHGNAVENCYYKQIITDSDDGHSPDKNREKTVSLSVGPIGTHIK